MSVSPSLENYLETIYYINQRNGVVRITDIAIELGISKPSVSRAIGNLKKSGMVKHEHYGSLTLTPEGYAIAYNIANRHVVIKKFLTEILKVDEKTADEDACKMEHAISQQTLEKLEAYIDSVLL